MATKFDYAPAPESRSIVDINPSYGLFINGEFVDGHGKAFKTVNPASEEVLAEIAEADDNAVDLAVLESIDNGKPIKESRDVDVPIVSAHFFYYAGWADKLKYAGFGEKS